MTHNLPTVSIKKALACQAYDIMMNGVSLGRRGRLYVAMEEGKALAKKAGVAFEGYKRAPKKSTERSEFKGRHKAFPKGWAWGEAV